MKTMSKHNSTGHSRSRRQGRSAAEGETEMHGHTDSVDPRGQSYSRRIETDRPLVSVIMPVYNHRDFVVDAIKSVYAQTYRPIELIIIDDGSSDNSPEAVKAFIEASPPEGVQIRFHKRENRGAPATINEGLRQAAGEYLTILNSDDLYTSERLERCVERAQLSRARLVFTYVTPIGSDGKPLNLDHAWRAWYNALVINELDKEPSLSFLTLANNLAVSSGNLFFTRGLVEEIGAFRDYKYAHDVDFVLRTCRLEEPVLIRDSLYCYRIHAQNTISQASPETEEEYQSIVYDYLRSTLSDVPNSLAPSFRNWPNSLGNMEGPAAGRLIRALDSFIEPARPPSSVDLRRKPTPSAGTSRPPSFITVASHEMSRTGAPVLLLEVAKSLKQAGVAVDALSLKDGPLVPYYPEAGIPVTIIPSFMRLWSGAGFRRLVAKALVTGLILYGTPVRREPRRQGPRRTFSSAKLSSSIRQAAQIVWRMMPWRRNRKHRWRLLRKFHSTKIQLAVFGRRPQLSEWLLRVLFWRHPVLTNCDSPLLLNSFASYPLAFQLLQLWKGPVFWYIHETYDPQILLGNEATRSYFNYILKKANVSFLFGSDATRQVWARMGYDGHVRYWSGLPASLAKKTSTRGRPGNKPDRRVILSVGTSGPRKGTRALIEAFALGRTRGKIPPEAELVIVGVHPAKDPQSRDLVLRALSPDIRGRVRLVAMAEPEALHSYYAEAEFYVQSSIMECMPLALLTAMAYGLPIVTTDADGCKEAIVDGVSGLVVPQRQIELMADAIGQLFESGERAQHFGKLARQRFLEKFSLEVTLGPLMELLLSEQVPLALESAGTSGASPPFWPKTASPSVEPVSLALAAEADHQSIGQELGQRRLRH